MSTPQDIVAEVLRGQWMPPAEQAAHVVSKLTDAGYSLVQLPTVVGECEDKYPLSDPPLLCQRVSGHPGIHEAVDASDDRFVWPNLDPATSTCRHCWEPIDHSDGRWRHTENGFGMLTCGSAYRDAGGNYYFAAPTAAEGEKS